MTATAHEKVNAGHLKRNAYLYIRQSTLRQVIENMEVSAAYGVKGTPSGYLIDAEGKIAMALT